MRRRLACGCSRPSLGPPGVGAPSPAAAAGWLQYMRRFHPGEVAKPQPGFRVYGALTATGPVKVKY